MLNFERDPHQSGAKVKAIQQMEYGSCCGMATKNCRMWIWQTLFLGPIHILQDTACCLPFLWHEPIFNSHNYYYAGRLIENCAPNVCRLQYDHEKPIVDHFAVANVCDHLFGQWIDRDNRQVIFFSSFDLHRHIFFWLITLLVYLHRNHMDACICIWAPLFWSIWNMASWKQ